MNATAEAEFPGLFSHQTRADWGVGVLSGERDGKRTYLFEGGVERVMGQGAVDMMRRVTSLSPEQQSTLAQLTALVARRNGLPDFPTGVGVVNQVKTLRAAFPHGLADEGWQSEKHAAKARETLVARARAELSLAALDSKLKAQQLEALWAAAADLLSATGWVTADQLRPPPGTDLSSLVAALRELLYGSATLEQRVDRFSVAFETAFGRPARWELTTGFLALTDPDHHVLVDLATFRKQLKLIGSKGTLPNSPNGAAYVRSLNAARIVASKLTEQGVMPRDLLDVHDFIRFTLKPAKPVPRPKGAKAAKAPKKKARANEDDESSEAEELEA